MTVETVTLLKCDAEGCTGAVHHAEHATASPKVVRTAAAKDGWQRRRIGELWYDLCPAHAIHLKGDNE